MKNYLFALVVMLVSIGSNAQFSKAKLQATGLTCAMCSNAINKALKKIVFIESVQSDIKNSAFNIVFKENETIDIDAIKNAVEDAGFSIGSLKLTGTFDHLEIANDKHVKLGNENFHFLNVSSQVLNGEKTITVIDKNFVTVKEFKKLSSATRMDCFQTGKADACCTRDGMPADSRIYHVTI